MSLLTRLNILMYICLLIFPVLFLVVVNTRACGFFTVDKTLCRNVHKLIDYC